MTQTIEIPEGFELKKVSNTEYKIVKKENVLPKGTQYYIGMYEDLVSLELIIFKNKFRYWIYKIFHK